MQKRNTVEFEEHLRSGKSDIICISVIPVFPDEVRDGKKPE